MMCDGLWQRWNDASCQDFNGVCNRISSFPSLTFTHVASIVINETNPKKYWTKNPRK